MKITIHRGSNQIGGCVTEISHEGYKLFIDLGEQLPGTHNTEKGLAVEGLTQGNTDKSALLITHYHADHIGELLKAQPDVPVYMGKTAWEIYQCYESKLTRVPEPTVANKHKHMLERISEVKTFVAGQPFCWGSMTVTPLMVDHSAFDAYMFVIEAGGVRLLYTGDFRGHGFRSKALPKLMAKYAQGIDYIISEGTNVYRAVENESEQSLQRRFTEEFRQCKYNFVFTSSTNIDRIFSLYHAAQQAGRLFVCDHFQYQLMEIVAKSHENYTTFYQIREKTIYVVRRRKNGVFFIPDRLLDWMKQKGFCMPMRDNSYFWNVVAQFDGDSDQAVYYSLWKGYVEADSQAYNEKLAHALARYPDYKYMHTSGHCDIRTLEALFRQVKPRKGIIPIHTEHPERFKTLFGEIAPVILLQDGGCLECAKI